MAASGLTFLQIVNRVLERMRETSVANYNSTDYSTMIAGMVNTVKAEIESSWQWHAMRDTFSVTCTDGVSQYALTDAGMNAKVIDAWNVTTGQELAKGTYAGFNRKFFGVGSGNSVPTGSPCEYIQSGLDANHDVLVDVYPVPVTGQLDTLKFNAFVPQDDLAANGTVPLVPQNVLIEETIARALNERGDENAPKPNPGETFIMQDLLDTAIAVDRGYDDSEQDWQVE
jgi:hypothetical protein